MNKENKITITIVFLIVIFIIQYYLLMTKSTEGHILDYKYSTEHIQFSYRMQEMLSKVVASKIDSDSKFTFVTNYDDEIYNLGGMDFLILRYELFPIEMITRSKYNIPIRNNPDSKQLIKRYDVDYILAVNENLELYDYVTTKELTLYKVVDKKNNKLEVVFENDMSLYGFYDLYYRDNETEYFFDMLEEAKKQIAMYQDHNAYQIIRTFIDDLFANEEYSLGVEYASYYLSSINAIDEKFNIYLGDYYFDNNDYNNAKKYYSACLHNDLCDSSYVNKKLAEINMKGE